MKRVAVGIRRPVRFASAAAALLSLLALAGSLSAGAVPGLASPGSAVSRDGCSGSAAVCPQPVPGGFALVADGRPATIHADPADDPGVLRALRDLRSDLADLGGEAGALELGTLPSGGPVVIVGTLEGSRLVGRLVRDGRLDVSGLEGEWEAFVQQVVERPLPGVDRALVIAGSDRRGAIFGVYDLAERAGVSPWRWWADVPVPRRRDLHVTPGRRLDRPAVKYRGIFINDENPALLGWANETFGGFNHDFYEKVFELILRLKGNYLWPAMWGKAFHDDDPLNPRLADEYGVVVGTSHHEPMMRAHVEWERYGRGPWDYTVNAEALRRFWRRGIERMGGRESLVTIGMRGDGDEPMTEGTAIELLETIVADQRRIIGEVTGRDPAETPQVWALYKEVQDYYDQGMRVPDDVTLLFSDDNWGNLRRLPPAGARRDGGYGVYYHFDYVGGPRSYKWINTTQIERVWEQMHLAYAHGVRRIWIVNVGDIKPMEYPIDFFLDTAWDPADWPLERLADYPREWAAQQFGPAHAGEIAELLTRYTKYNARRKPELLGPDTYSLVDFREAERVVAEHAELARRADAVRAALPPGHDDAFVQLVWFPIHASANLNRLYHAVARNRLYAAQGRAATNDLAAEAEALFERDATLTRLYHEEVAGRKWRHIMSQLHIGYSGWREPERDVMPAVERIDVSPGASMGIAVEGEARAWPGAAGAPTLPPIDVFHDQVRHVEVFNRGMRGFRFTARPDAPWLEVTPPEGDVDRQLRLTVEVDWDAAPEGRRRAAVVLEGSEGTEVVVHVETFKPGSGGEVSGFVESDGYVAMEATHPDRAIGDREVEWKVVPELGRTGSGITPFPVTAAARTPGGASPRLEYDIHLFDAGVVTVETTLAPTLDFKGRGGLRYAVSIDDAPPVVVDVHADGSLEAWEESVARNAHVRTSRHRVVEAGPHTVKLWMVDPGLVFQRLVVATGEVPPSYLGPPESARIRPPGPAHHSAHR